MRTISKIALAAAVTLASMSQAEARGTHKSTISFGTTEKLATKAGKKRNFKQDIAAVNASHESWKKAHLNTVLYACQRNSEKIALLARKVADRLETSKKETILGAKALEKTVEETVGAETNEVPDTLPTEQVDALKAKAKLLESAKKQAELLERLSGQVMNFYVNDMPKESSSGSGEAECRSTYPAAMKKGVVASKQYHADAEALSKKLGKLTKLADLAWKRASARVMFAAATK